jgi:hypothetical protein
MVLLALVLAGCDGHDPSSKGQAPATSTPTSTRTPAPTSSPNASPAGAGIPDDFPLAQGLTADADNTVTTPRRDVKGVDLQSRCWHRSWPGAAVDRLVVQQVGPELSVTRELAVYRDVATARAVAQKVRVHAAQCHRLPATSGQPAMDVTPLSGGHTGVAHVASRFAETTAGGEPGGAVFVFTRVGRAILAVEDSGEWTRGSAVRGARKLEGTDRVVVARLCTFRAAGC